MNLFRRLRYLFDRDRFARDLGDEMRLHQELRARKLEAQGLTPADAVNAARRQFGNRTAVLETSAETWGWAAWENLFADLRYAARALRKTPGFTAVAVVTLALGLGMNTAVFSVVNAVMIRELPYPDPQRLVALWELDAGRRTVVAPANLSDYRRGTPSFEGLAGYNFVQHNLTGNGSPVRILGEAVTHDYFRALGVAAQKGRGFLPEEDRPGANYVVVLSHEFWRRRLGEDQSVLERGIVFDGHAYRVIGVLPPEFVSPAQFGQPERVEFYVPAAYPADLLASRDDHEINVVGRLRRGASLAAAQAELDLVSKQIPHSRVVIQSLQDDVVRGVRDSLLAILGASGLIVLITCVNVANLLLVRAIARRHETSVRVALGAGRLRIARQYLAESLLVAAAGSAAGLLLGRALLQLLIAIAPANIPRIAEVTMDWRVFAVSTAIATVTGIVFGIAPAWHASRARPVDALKTAARHSGGLRQVRWRTSLTVAEVALSLILAIGAGLLIKSFVLVMGVDLGFRPERVLTLRTSLSETNYRTAAQRLQFFEQVERRMETLPGVQSVAFANRMPLNQAWSSGFVVDNEPSAMHSCDFQAVSPRYFETLGIGLQRGRFFTPADGDGEAPVALVNNAFAREFLGGGDALGRRVRRGSNMPWLTVVGVVNDIRRGGKTSALQPEVYLAAAQTKVYPVRLSEFAVRGTADPRGLVNAIRREIWAVDKDQPLTGVLTMEEIVSATVGPRRFQTLLLGIFAAVAVGLAVVGVFGVLAYSVSQRTSELGIRIALGARPAGILLTVLRQAAMLVAAGLVAGLGGAYALTRYLQTMLFRVEPHDWSTYAIAGAVLAAVSLVAALVPARRGARVDPIVALRYE